MCTSIGTVQFITTYPRTHTLQQLHTYIHEGRDEAMASGGQILETKKEPEIVLLKYLYYPPENLSSRRHGFIPTFTCMNVHDIHTYIHSYMYTSN